MKDVHPLVFFDDLVEQSASQNHLGIYVDEKSNSVLISNRRLTKSSILIEELV